MLHLNQHHAAWIGQTVTDALGQKIGKIDDIYTDDDTGQPEWLAISTGLMGSQTHFVPMRGATSSGSGVQVPFPKDKVKVAPGAGIDGRLSRMEKGRLYAHYGYSYAEERNRMQRSLGFDRPGPSRPADGHVLGRAVELYGMSGPADVRQVIRPSDRHEEGERPPLADHGEAERPPAARGEGRGRWPDDEAIFGLTQEVAYPTLAGVASRGR